MESLLKMKVLDLQGNKVKEIKTPEQFNEPYHPNLIKRAVLAIRENKRQPYGAYPLAGKRQAVDISRRRKDYKGSYGKGMSRVARKTMWHRGSQFAWEGAFVPGTKGGRKAHPPKAEKNRKVKVNVKENRKAIRSALSASLNETLVKLRNHRFTIFPLIIVPQIEDLKKTSEVLQLLNKFGLKDELARAENKKIRAGKGKFRGRKYRIKKGPLFVVSKNCPLVKAVSNIPGVEIVPINRINAELLAPGTQAGRLTIYSESAIEKLEKEKLFI